MKRLVFGVVFACLAAVLFFLDVSGFQEQVAPNLSKTKIPINFKQPKVSSALAELMQLTQEKSSDEVSRFALEQNLTSTNGSVRVVITIQPGTAAEVISLIAELDGKTESSIDDLVRALVPIGKLSDLAGSKAVRWIMPWHSFSIAFDTVSEGASVIGAPAWHQSGLTGQ